MLGRRQLLISVSLAGLAPPLEAVAIVPAILAALAAITALAVATGKAAEAMEAVVSNGQRLWTVIASVPEKERARRILADEQAKIRQEMGVRREVVRDVKASQSVNSAFVNSVRYYLITRDSSAWAQVLPAMNRAADALEAMAGVFRQKAAWFPAAAQDALSQLPRLYEGRVSIITDLQRLSREKLPSTNEEVDAWTKLVDGYDQLRVQSLKLIRALDEYTSPSAAPFIRIQP